VANTTFAELKRQVMLKLRPRSDGITMLAVDQAINEAHKVIARVKDFDELIVLDTTHAFTAVGQKLYNIESDLNLVRPKDIYSIRYMDGANSRKLIYISPRELDERIPYTELFTTGRPRWYTRRGMNIELFCIPGEVKPLYIMHSQWPKTLTLDSDQTSYCQLDDVITTLAADIAISIAEGGGITNWLERAKMLLGSALTEEETRPDVAYVAKPFSPEGDMAVGKYWLNPWIKKQP